MTDFSWINEMTDNEKDQFQKVIRKLLGHTFIVKEKDPTLYQFIKRSSNQINISEYLEMMGYTLIVTDDVGVAKLELSEDSDDTAVSKNENFQRFTTDEVVILLILIQMYLSKMRTALQSYTTYGELINRIKYHERKIGTTAIANSLRTLKKFNLVDFSSSENTNNTSEDMAIKLYPSLLFCMSSEQMLSVIKEKLSDIDVTNDDVIEDVDLDLEIGDQEL